MQNFSKNSSSKKQAANNNQTLTRNRQIRLKKSTSLLGQPDIITVTKIKITSSFFSRQKKNEQSSEYFINGIIFPTTAHFSTYISSKYQNSDVKNHSNMTIKARLIMFDAFQQRDIHVQINIPGSLQIKIFNLSGQALKPEPEDYERAYFSSYLRSLQPMNYPNIVLNPYIYKVQIHKQVLRKLIPFCFQNSLRQLDYNIRAIYTSQLQQEYDSNLALQIVINFFTKYKLNNLIDLLISQIQKLSHEFQLKNIEYLNYRLSFLKKQYTNILAYSSQVLIENPNLKQWKQLQIQCLYKLKNYKPIKLLGQNLIKRGGTHSKIYQLICGAYLQTKDFKNFLKVFNSILTLYNQDEVFVNQISHKTKKLYFMDLVFNKGENISAYPELCFQFDNDFLNKQNKLTLYKESIIQSQNPSSLSYSKQEPLVQIFQFIQKIDQSLQYKSIFRNNEENNDIRNIKTFYALLVKFEKIKSWSEVIKFRGQSFWLQTDFKNQEESIMDKSILSASSFNTSTYKKANQRTSNFQTPSKPGQKLKTQPFGHIQMNQIQKSQLNQIQFDNHQNSFHQDDLSQNQEQQEIQYMPACSKRLSNNANTARRNFANMKKTLHQQNLKVLCSISLQRLFVSLYQDLRLQIQVEKWAAKINLSKISQITPQKRQLYSIIFLKKAFLHLKLERFRKCEESLKVARRLSQSPLTLIISSYQLIQLYMKTNSMKGVEYYIVDLIKVFNLYGIKKFDIVPEWAKQIITYIIQNQGIGILGYYFDQLRKLAGPFKQLLVRWLRNNHSQSSLFKKDSANKSQNMYKVSS